MTDHEALSRAANENPIEHLPIDVLHDYLEETTGRLAPTKAEVYAFTGSASTLSHRKLKVQFGRRYAKLHDEDGVYCFVDLKNGDVLMAASRKAPAKKHPRGNIRDAFGGMQWLRHHGVGYLKNF